MPCVSIRLDKILYMYIFVYARTKIKCLPQDNWDIINDKTDRIKTMFSSWWEEHNTWYLRSYPFTNISIHHSIIVPVSEIIPSVSPPSLYIYTYWEIYTIPSLCLYQRSYPQWAPLSIYLYVLRDLHHSITVPVSEIIPSATYTNSFFIFHPIKGYRPTKQCSHPGC